MNMDTSDYDRDGIIDSSHSHTHRSKGDKFKSQSLSMYDYDGDGQADHIYMSKEKGSSSGTLRTEYIYNTESSSRPILEIIQSRDGQIIAENAAFRTLTSDYTEMGGHVLELSDVIKPVDSVDEIA